MNKLYIAGIGPGGPEYMTRKAYRILQEADLIVVIHPLKESAGIYLEKWPVMKHHRACRLVNAETAAIVQVE